MIDLSSITKCYGSGASEFFALRSVSLSIAKGEFVAIMGPSGSGKSTLMNIIGCLDVPTRGTYLLDGLDVSNLSDDDLAQIRNTKIGFVFQAFHLLPRATVLKNVTLPLMYAGAGKRARIERAAHSLAAAALPKQFWNYFPNQLSGGMMQRVAIARALTNDPAIILADEPTGNLDTATGMAVLETFQMLHARQGRTIVLITHERYVAEHAERIVSIRDGAIVEDAPVAHRRLIHEESLT